ncbi:SDR family NAD(P)-dependent oxidoreductase [Cryobacterium melibiosiphilum]|uniref:SDR family NAD(P)-dependent oxidoreductase n=1 Tax=Cryobacterium melibiosiphilum TaxID=995039 RepID=A0A3A5MGL0_9MICO|nr:SDR family NAD(P)-dependent oxidoreductase [Cryobacterium melibiosiphilum]RJT88245.1 SDR family NAD(P)-dependent oxidoreductase [Cryobacterium melibiosiphilum]
MSKRTIVITGASDGIGAAAARNLSRRGDNVVIVGRSATKTRQVADELGADFFVADFAVLAEVRALAATLLERYPRIDVLANNAGGIMGARQSTVDGNEKTFQVNHLAPFLLTSLLMDRLVQSHATVINTSSAANSLLGNLVIGDLNATSGYSANKAYGDAKLANILFTTELHRRFHEQGVSTAAFHPGGVATGFATGSTSVMRLVYTTWLKRFLKTPEQGADTLVWLATTKPGVDWVSGEYYDKRTVAKANKQADDAGLARELWERSLDLVAAPVV